jgi:catechol-2,3-dioxygenase
MRAAAVLYVRNLDLMRDFYRECFALGVDEETDDYCVLLSEAWMLTLVKSAHAPATTIPAARRENTPIKLAFSVPSIAALRTVVARLGGQMDLVQSEWESRNMLHCDGLDPEGNVVQLMAPVQP